MASELDRAPTCKHLVKDAIGADALIANTWVESPSEISGMHQAMYQKTTLENGIRIVTETNPAVRSVAIGILIDAGPRDEIPEQRGLAHLVEHAMFQGTAVGRQSR